MNLKRREKILVYCVGGLAALLVGYLLFGTGDSHSVEELHKFRDEKLYPEVKRKEKLVREANEDAEKLAAWQRRSVPAEQATYTDWLRKLATRFITQPFTLNPSAPEPHKGVYTKFTFTISGHATMGALTQFLYEFYKAGDLHQIRHLTIKPLQGQNPREPLVDVSLIVEAFSLAGVDRKERTTEAGHGLQQGKTLADYQRPITSRQLFVAYVRRERPGEVDTAKYAFITGITVVDGKKSVWVQDRMAGRMLKLYEGEKFQIGDAHGVVRTIADDEVTVDFDGHRRLIRNGDNLRGGVEVKNTE